PATDSQLQFSAGARAPIRLAARASTALNPKDCRDATVRICGARIRIQARVFSRLVDGLMLLAAVLLFSVVGISITHILPTWPTALAMVAVLTSVLVCLNGSTQWNRAPQANADSSLAHIAQVSCYAAF